MGSFLEIGYGSNDLILENPNQRYKLNARIERKWSGNQRARVFAHISADVDASNGSDSIQTYLGLYYMLGSTD